MRTDRTSSSSIKESYVSFWRNRIVLGLAIIFSKAALNAQPLGDSYVVPELGLRLIWLSAHTQGESASFTMGSPESEGNRLLDENQHQVTLTKGFYLGEFEVTQSQYEAVMRGNTDGLPDRPSNFPEDENLPVESISWYEATKFVEILNQKEKLAGRLSSRWSYVLPTEAQWEYACRGGSTTPFNTGNSLGDEQSNFIDNAAEKPLPVGQFQPNQWGLYDMHGNVMEWCRDWYVSDYKGSYTDPSGPNYIQRPDGGYRNAVDYFGFNKEFVQSGDLPPIAAPQKVYRGGAFDSPASGARSARRYHILPNEKLITVGFRLALTETESLLQLEQSMTVHTVSISSGDRYTNEIFWEDTGASTSLESTINEISDLFDDSTKQFSGDLRVRVPFSANSKSNRLVEKGKTKYWEELPVVPIFIEADYLDLQGNSLSIDRNISFGDFYKFMKKESSISSGHQPEVFASASYAMKALPVGYLGTWAETFLANDGIFLDEGNFIQNSNGWRWAKWFGYYYAGSFPWIYHENLGWVFVDQSHSDMAWLFRENLGWIWTTSTDWWTDNNHTSNKTNNNHPFPYIYRFGTDTNDTKLWTYLDRSSKSATLYDFVEEEWFLLDKPYEIKAFSIPEDGGSIDGMGQYFRWSKVSLSANSSLNYKFLDWRGELFENNNQLEINVIRDLELNAFFLPLDSSSLTSEQRAVSYRNLLAARDELSAAQKEQAFAELLFLGNSPTAGIP